MYAVREIQPIVTDVRNVSVSIRSSLSLGSTRLHCAKTAERIKMMFGMTTLGSQQDIVLHGGADPP